MTDQGIGGAGSQTDAALWTEIQIDLPAEVAEILAAALIDVTDGVEIRDGDTLLAAPEGRAILVTLCEPNRSDEVMATVAAALAQARSAGMTVDPVTIRQRAAHEDEWRDVWKQFFRATRIGRRFIVRPSWDPGQIEDSDQVIDLDPGRAFGTGAHPSTRLVIAMAETLADAGLPVGRFLDLGCGSGILSIAAARLWPQAAGLAVDIDPEACACSQENLDRNRITTVAVHDGVLVSSDARFTDGFELILANIQAEVLQPLAPALFACVRPGGHALLSGLLVEQGDRVAETFAGVGFEIGERRVDGEWVGINVKRPRG